MIAALQAQNVVSPSGTLRTSDERLTLRVSGAFDSEEDLQDLNFVANGQLVRLRDIANIHRAYADPPQPMFRVNGKPAMGLAVSMREGGDILALGRNITAAMQEITADMPIGIDTTLVANQPQVVDDAIGEFTTSLWQAILIIMAVSFISLGIRAGTVVALAIPLSLAMVFAVMQIAGIDLQRVSLGALIIALSLLVDDAMTTVDSMTTRLALGDEKEEAASFTFRTLAAAMLTGTLVTATGFVPIGFARSSAGEYTFSIFAVVSIALVVSWLGAVIFSPLLGVALLQEAGEYRTWKAIHHSSLFPQPAPRRVAYALADHRPDACVFRTRAAGTSIRAATILPIVGPSRAARRYKATAKRIDSGESECLRPAPTNS